MKSALINYSRKTNPNVALDTKIAMAFYDLGFAYEKRNRFDLAIENYKKALDYDDSLQFIKVCIQNIVIRQSKINNTFKNFITNINNIDKTLAVAGF